MIKVFDRRKQRYFQERVYGERAVELLWGEGLLSKTLGRLLGWCVANFSLPSTLFGLWAKSRFSQQEIESFVERFEVDISEFEEPLGSFSSFNAFFTRRLKEEARPIDQRPGSLVIPADGRYLFYERASLLKALSFKGKHWSLEWLLQDEKLAETYREGSLLLGRLAPPDYHWFHFPYEGVPGRAKLIPGPLFSVNPLALKKRPTILCENRRRLTPLHTPKGTLLLMEVGATNVGSIQETFEPGAPVERGAPKGYFSFGGSEVILLFPPAAVTFEEDLLEKTQEGVEVLCQMGEAFGKFL